MGSVDFEEMLASRIEHVIPMLRQMSYDPAAFRGFELLSWSFSWSDEIPEPGHGDIWVFEVIKRLSAHRSSIICGEPDGSYAALWERIQRECPHWPGFRPERCDPALRPELECAEAEELEGIEDDPEEYEEEQ